MKGGNCLANNNGGRLLASCPEKPFMDIKYKALEGRLHLRELVLLSLVQTLDLPYTAEELKIREEAVELFKNLIKGE